MEWNEPGKGGWARAGSHGLCGAEQPGLFSKGAREHDQALRGKGEAESRLHFERTTLAARLRWGGGAGLGRSGRGPG